ncbi:hypothetical protein HOA92_01600 [archaeon]|nr:hypothetical protein [archaeon]MBT6761707.1 hypothetical protein [archaeon]
MVSKVLQKHKQHLQGKFSAAEYSHVEEILKSSEEFLRKSGNILFFSSIFVIFFLTLIMAFVVLPFKQVLPSVLFLGIFGSSAFVFGIIIIYFVHINPEFERHHHWMLLGILVLFSFLSVFIAHLFLGLLSNPVVSGSMLSEWPVAAVISVGFLIPYLLYWVLVE